MAELSKKRRAPYPGEETHRLTPNKARVVSRRRVRNPRQKSRHQVQNTHHKSKLRKDANAALEAERGRSAKEIVILAIKRYNVLQLLLIIPG